VDSAAPICLSSAWYTYARVWMYVCYHVLVKIFHACMHGQSLSYVLCVCDYWCIYCTYSHETDVRDIFWLSKRYSQRCVCVCACVREGVRVACHTITAQACDVYVHLCTAQTCGFLTRLRVWVCVRIYVYIYTYMHICMYVYMYSYIYIYICIYINIYINV